MKTPEEEALSIVLSAMAENVTETWTTSELYSMYLDASGTVSKRQFISKVTTYFDDKLMVLHIEGCESIVGFKDNFGKFLKMVQVSTNQDGDETIEKLVRNIKKEVLAKPKPKDYNLSDFAYHKIIESISETLLKLVSTLVSGGSVTKPSLTLAQCIQQHLCDGYRNQTTLGLAVKLHHKYGSSELIQTLNEHGITSTYDEVQCFRKSVA